MGERARVGLCVEQAGRWIGAALHHEVHHARSRVALTRVAGARNDLNRADPVEKLVVDAKVEAWIAEIDAVDIVTNLIDQAALQNQIAHAVALKSRNGQQSLIEI